MSEPVDKLRQRCEEMLADNEQIELDAECVVYNPRRLLFPNLGVGRAFLTDKQLIWIRRDSPPMFRPLLSWMRMPELIHLSVSGIEILRRERWGLRAFYLRIRSEGKDYVLRLGRGPYPLLRLNPQTSEEWFSMLERLRNPPAEKAESGRSDG